MRAKARTAVTLTLIGALAAVPAVASADVLPPAPAAAREVTPDAPPAAGVDGVLDLRHGLDGDAGSGRVQSGGAAAGGGAERADVVAPEAAAAVGRDVRAGVLVRLEAQADLGTVAAEARHRGRDAAAAVRGSLALRGPAHAGLDRAARRAAHTARVATVVEALRDVAERTRGDVARLLGDAARRGAASDVRPLWVFNGFAATVDVATLEALAAHPDVAQVTLDATIALDEPDVVAGPRLPSWSVERVGAPRVWGDRGITGAGVVVGILDSGADGGHPALAGRYRGRHGDHDASWFAATGENYPTPGDGHGHGTHVAATAVGGPPGEVVGVAPGAEWIAAKIFRDTGTTTASVIHTAAEWLLAPGGDPANAPHVVNNSWGSNATLDREYWDDVAAWRAAGIVPVFANGNAGPGPGTVGSPASFPHAIGVGATDRDDVIASFSARGPVTWDGQAYTKPQVSAPGVAVRSAWPDALGGGYRDASGTSMAAPHATGVAALVMSANPELDVDGVQHALESTARVAAHMGEVPGNAYGHGVVDAHAAVTLARFSGVVAGTVRGPGGPLEASVRVAGAGVGTTSDPVTGSFELAVPEGEWTVSAAAFGFHGASAAVTVVAGAHAQVDLDLDEAAVRTLSGTVTGSGGAPVAGARVALPDTPLEVRHTGADGRFEANLPEGDHRLAVSASGYRAVTRDVTVDGDTAVDVALRAISTAGAEGWAEFQNNPSNTGTAAEALVADTLEPAWTRELGARAVFNGAVSAGDAVYLTTEDGRLHALDAADGRVRWTFTTGANLRSTPLVADGTVYAGGGDSGTLHALDAVDGTERWAFETGDRLTYTTPTIVDGTLYFATGWGTGDGGTVYALDPGTGAERWSAFVGGQVFFGPAAGGGLVFAASYDERRLVALDAASGDLVWETVREDDSFVGAATYADGDLYVVTTDFDSNRGSVLAYDAATGALRWEADGHGGGQGNAPVVYDDLVIAGSHTRGSVDAYDRAGGEVVWRHAAGPAVSVSQLATLDGYVVGGSQVDRRVWALDAATGARVWEDTLSDSVLTAPALADGRLVVADGRGRVVAYRPTGTVTGAVTGPGGPVAATVSLAGTGVETDTEAGTGAFTLTHAPGTYTLAVRSYGHEQVDREVTIEAGRAARADVELGAVGDGRIEVTVTGADGGALAGAVATLAGTPLEPATSRADGTLAFGAVAAGRYTLEVALAGYVTAAVEVEAAEGEVTAVAVTLDRYQVAVLGDHQGRIAAVLSEAGVVVEHTGYAAVAERASDFEAVVANGAQDAPDAQTMAAFLDATDAAGTSVVWLDQWSVSYGAIRALSQATGNPDSVVTGSREGRVSLVALAEHPLTAALEIGERVGVLAAGSDFAAFAGYRGHVLADVRTDTRGTVGAGIGFEPRGLASAHVLLPLHAATPWSGPGATWQPVARRLLLDAVDYARAAAYGAVAGRVDDGAGAPRGDAEVTVVETGERVATGADGDWRLLLAGGDWTLRFDRLGSVPETRTVTVAPGGTVTLNVSLPDSGFGAVTGTVTSRGGALEGAEVALAGTDIEPAVTGADGTYLLDGVPAGTYDVGITAPGHVPVELTGVDVAAGAATRIDAELDATARAGVLGDRMGQLTALLNEAGVAAREIGWDVAELDDLDVVVLNHPTDPGAATFRAFLDAMDEREVSGVFADDRFTAYGSVRLLRSHVGDPSEHLPVSPEGDMHLVPRDPDHPLFAGFDGPVHVLAPGAYNALLDRYSGEPLADLETEQGGLRGVGAAFVPRTPASVHLLVGGLAATVFQHPAQRWTDDTPRFFANMVRWAAAPGLGTVSGTVTDPEGAPVAGARVAVSGGGREVATASDGRYALPLAPGEVTLEVSAFGYVPAERDVSVGRNQAVTLDVALDIGPVGTVAGTVTARPGIGTDTASTELRGVQGVQGDGSPPDIPGTDTASTELRGVQGVQGDGSPPDIHTTEPVAGARVRLLGTPREAVTDDAGAFVLDRVAPGSYEVEVLASGYVRTIVDVEVAAGERADADVALRPSPRVGVLDDFEGRAAAYLEHWGYEAVAIGWDDLEAVAEIDLVLANLASFPNLDPGADGWRAFSDAVDRAGAPVIWLDQFGRGAIQWLRDYEGDPAGRHQDRGATHGRVTATVATDHPLVAGLPEAFELTEPGREYAYFDGYSGTTVASLTTDLHGERGSTIAYRGRAAASVDVLLSTLSISTYGWPGVGGEPGHRWTPGAERVLRNALAWALDAPPLAAEARGTVRDAAGAPLSGSVTVAESGGTYAVREGDGTFLVPLQPGTWTLEVSSFGYETAPVEVTVTAGEVARPQVVLQAGLAGSISGRVTSEDGLALDGAVVRVLGTPLTAETDAGGGYAFATVPAGDWTLEVRRDGYRVTTADVTVRAGGAVTLDVTLPASDLVAVAGDSLGRLESFLSDLGYEVHAYPYNGLAQITEQVGDYALVILNGVGAAPSAAVLTEFVEAAAAADVSVAFAGQWGGGALNHARQHLGDPGQVSWGFVPQAITYTPEVAHPIFAGFEPGEPVEILRNTPNQQYVQFGDYSGTTIATVGDAAGDTLGGGVGYRFTSPTSVHVLLAGLQVGTYGAPETRWTPAAAEIYASAVAWAIDATQGEVTGTVTSGGEPVADATVTAVEAGASARTGPDGRYRLGVPDGTHTIRVAAFGFEPHTETVAVAESGSVTLDVDLVPLETGTLTGTVTAGGQPLAGAEVAVAGLVERDTTTAADGTFTVAGLYAGDYEVTVSAGGHLPVTTGVTVTAGETATLTVALRPYDVAVLGDAGGAVVTFLRERDVSATGIGWDEVGDLSAFAVVVVNGGEADAEQFATLLDAADADAASLVFTGTWGVASGGLRLLERHTDDVVVGGHGYRGGVVTVTGFDAAHPLFDGLDDPAEILAPDSYWSWVDRYVGHALADLGVGDAGRLGGAAAYDWRGPRHAHLLLSASAASDLVGPGYGWTPAGERLLLNAVDWLREAEQPLPAMPSLEAEAERVAAGTVTVHGTAFHRETVTVRRDGEPVATAEPARDGTFSAGVPLVEGPNTLDAVASNFAGDSPASAPVVVVRDTQGPALDWTPADGTGVLEAAVEVAGTATDPGGVATVTVNGAQVEVSATGAFGVAVALDEGANTIEVRATDTLGNETVSRRTVAYLPLDVRWQVPPQASARGATPVRVTVSGPDGRPVALAEAVLVVSDRGGEVVRADLAPAGDAWSHHLRGLDPGDYELAAEVALDGWHVRADGPALRLR